MDNQCLDCKMKFDSSEALATHVKKVLFTLFFYSISVLYK